MRGDASTDVYATARQGVRSRLGSRLASRARARRHERFATLTGITPHTSIVDVGCGVLGLRGLEPGLDVMGVDVAPRPGYPGPFVQADVLDGLPFEDGAFDLVHCSSVIEHVPRADRTRFAAEIRRIGRGWYVQTPAFSFPVEPHALLPAAHWLPPLLRRPYWRLGVAESWEDIPLLRRSEMETLFGDTQPERVGPLVKSWISVKRVPPGA